MSRAVVFSHRCCDERDLHSFPTRRSSDLSSASPACLIGGATASAKSRGLGATSPTQWRRRRSEEHTSELQSRQYLVCRLLLEKKKRKHTSHGGPSIVQAAAPRLR